ncbi:MAG: hypothetical protein ACRCZI_08455 [Cetobacterium sp.]
MSTVNKYKIYCETESAYIEGWGTESPTVCYNNNTHTVNPNSPQIVEIVSSSLVSIKEDKISNGRNTWVENIVIEDVSANSTKSSIFTFPIAVSMYSFSFVTDSTNKGDDFSIFANENTTLGLIGADISAGATSLTAPAALLLYGYVGFHLTLTNGTNTNELGIIKTINKVTGIVTFETATVNSFLASNTLVKMTVRIFDNMRIGGAGVYKFFDDVIGGAAIPAGTVVKFTYKNNAILGSAKELSIMLTCLY